MTTQLLKKAVWLAVRLNQMSKQDLLIPLLLALCLRRSSRLLGHEIGRIPGSISAAAGRA